MPPNLPKDILKLAVELIKHQAKKQLGDRFIDVLSSRLVDYAGDNALEKVNALLESGENADKLLAAFQDADKDFHDQGDDTLRQMIVSKPLRQLESLEKLAKVLPKTLDDDGLLEALRHHFETDWPKHSAENHARAARAYRLCLERSLAVRCNQLLPSIFSKVERIEENTEKILDKLDSFKPPQSAPVSNWYLPFPRNEKFVGRDDDLQNLHAALQQGESVGVRPAMLSGMGGIGKTQLSVEYAYRYQAEYPGGIYWVNAAQDLLLKGMADIAEKIGLRPTDDVPESQRMTWLANAFAKHINAQKDSLVIFDNVEDPKVLRLPVASIIPTELKCHILFTTRRRDVDKTFYRSFEVTVLPENAALQLLLRHPSRQPILDSKHNDHTIARIICMTLGFLPLAIELAGAYLGTYNEISLWDYRKRLLLEGAMETVDDTELRPEDMPTRHDTAIHATLKLSWEAIQDDENARLALKAAGQLREAEMISIRLLSLLTGIENKSSMGRPNKIGRTLKKLYEFSLVEELTAEYLRLHPLVFAFASRLAEGGFRVGLADHLAEKLCNVEMLIQIAGEYGVDIVVADTQVGLWLYGTNSNKLYEELSLLNLIINNEFHTLRDWNAKKQPSFLPQQLYNRALTKNAQNWQDLLRKYLETQKLSWLEEKRRFSRISSAFLRIFEGHTDSVSAVAVTPDGAFAISASKDKTLCLWDLRSGERLRTFVGHPSEVESVSITPDGLYAISTSSNARILILWDIQSGKHLYTIKADPQSRIIGFALDEKHIIYEDYKDDTFYLGDIKSKENVHTFKGRNVTITPDGMRAISASKDGMFYLWDLQSGECLHTLEGYDSGGDRAVRLILTPDETHVISFYDNYSYRTKDILLWIWNLQTEKCLHKLEHKSYGKVHGVFISPDGTRAISSVAGDPNLCLWDIQNGKRLHILQGQHDGNAHGHAVHIDGKFTPDGKRFISFVSSSIAAMWIWDLDSGECLRTIAGHTSGVEDMAITPDGKRVISASSDKTLRLWNIETKEEPHNSEEFHISSVSSISITPDGKYAISSTGGYNFSLNSWDHSLRLWDIQSGECLRKFNIYGGANCVSVTPDGKSFVYGGAHEAGLKDIQTGELLCSFYNSDKDDDSDTNNVVNVAVTPDGQYAIITSNSHMEIWNIQSRKPYCIFQDYKRNIATIVSHNGVFAFFSYKSYKDKTLCIWDIPSGRCLRTFENHDGVLMAVTPNKPYAISASSDNSLRLWNTKSGDILHIFEGHAAGVYRVDFTPDGLHAISTSADKTLRLWDVRSGKCLLVLASETSFTAVAIGPNGDMIVAGDSLGVVHFIEIHDLK